MTVCVLPSQKVSTNESSGVATSLVADQVNAVLIPSLSSGASAALAVGGVPFEGPLACVRIGHPDTGEFWLTQPTKRDPPDLDLELGGSSTFISMLEAGADEISEEGYALSYGIWPGRGNYGILRSRRSSLLSGKRLTTPIVKREYILDEPIAGVLTASLLTTIQLSAAAGVTSPYAEGLT